MTTPATGGGSAAGVMFDRRGGRGGEVNLRALEHASNPPL